MKSWTLIPFYLWKNTFKRWLEYPVSPCSKILIPALLGFLAVIVLALFSEVERELHNQLSKKSLYTVLITEFVQNDIAPTVLRQSYEEELMWTERYGLGVIKNVRQPLITATIHFSKSTPVIAFGASVTEFGSQSADTHPTVWLLENNPAKHGEIVEISISDKRTVAEIREIPIWVSQGLGMEQAVAVPIVMIEPYLLNGFMNHTIAELDSLKTLEKYVTEVSAYYQAEKRNIKIVSALEILKNIEQINTIQLVVRSLIVLGCGIILALTLGSIAWLEYRQESYLLALLKSFGTPSYILLIHMFIENLILVVGGLCVVMLSWGALYKIAITKLRAIGLQATELPPIAGADFGIILLAGFIGVLFAMVPVAIGLRKPAGLILQ